MVCMQVWIEVSAGYRLPQPNGCLDDIYKLMLDCWAKAPEERPTFTKVVAVLKELLNTHCDWEDSDGYLDVGPLNEAQPKRGSLLKRMLSSGFSSKRSSTELQLRSTAENVTYESGPVDGAALYDMGAVDVEEETEVDVAVDVEMDDIPVEQSHYDMGAEGYDEDNDVEMETMEFGFEEPAVVEPLASEPAASDLYGNTDDMMEGLDVRAGRGALLWCAQLVSSSIVWWQLC